MVNIVAIILFIFSAGQICLGVMTILGKFDPLLSRERKKLPAKIRKKAKMLNAISMIITSVIFCILGVGLLTGVDCLIKLSAILMAAFIVIMLIVSIKVEGKYLK